MSAIAYTIPQMRSLVTHNFGLKLVSGLIALAIWYRYSLMSQLNVTQVFERHLKVIHKAPQLSVTHPLEDALVRITLSGRRLDLMQVDRQLEAQVDLAIVHSAIGEVSASVEAAFDPALGLQVVSIEPKTVKITVRSAEPRADPPLSGSPSADTAATPTPSPSPPVLD